MRSVSRRTAAVLLPVILKAFTSIDAISKKKKKEKKIYLANQMFFFLRK